ncbi:thioredoxin-like protein [Trichoderma novae-zelandiae]
MSAASPLMGLPSQQHQAHHRHHRSDQPQHHSQLQPQAHQPLSPESTASTSTSKRCSTATATATPTATAAMRRDMPAKLAGRGVIRLEIYMDLLCPWCFVGKHSLEALMRRYVEEHPDVRFEVTWKPYYIAPTMAKHNVDKRSIYDRLNALNPDFLPRIRAAGAKYDIAFSIRGLTGSTRPAHRLLALVLQRLGPAAQARAVEALFQGHFEDGRDLSDGGWLVAVGAAAGLEEGVARAGLADEGAGARVDAVAEAARDVIGVEAVPCVVVQGRYKVGGYQEGHVFESLFDKIRLAGEGF